ncbi:MAG: histidine phosphatase family protein [Alphaproteobacteria bacterium]|nr:histidine phosphatase family protein [Alphaproteobacteria bacterium]MBP7758515.1 histidine phosphatase family protein [Alphaproteobacteria bacterium]MBP7761948.1 histidine phosphatase family protein [Alphaproteobacteria bacterium]MBP7905772.1 histidine phosphatase family protein [Alphaproteobacteria bacterium]
MNKVHDEENGLDTAPSIVGVAEDAFKGAQPGLGSQKRLILMRHGNPDSREELGNQVAHSLAELFAAYPDQKFDAVLYSPVKRTVMTAAAVYNQHVDKAQVERPGFAFPFEKQPWLKDNAGAELGYEGLLDKVRELDDSWNTVLLVTHSTVAPLLAKVLKAPATDKELVFTMSDYASVLVLDIQSDSWADAGLTPARISKVISQTQTLDAAQLGTATDNFMQSLRTP